MARKLYCDNVRCKYHLTDRGCSKSKIEIDYSGCKSFEKGITYYIHLVWDALGNNNFISANSLTEDLRIGIHYILRLFHLCFTYSVWGSWEMIFFVKEDGGEHLKYDDIVAIDIDKKELEKILEEFEKNGPPNPNQDNLSKEPKIQPIGWLTPTGKFIECKWGHHRATARRMIKKMNFREEYDNSQHSSHPEDFLCCIKGWVLIHNPAADGSCVVTHTKELTKKQKEFLYQYFKDMGNTLRAEMYLKG